MKKYHLGLDIGTSSVKGVAEDCEGNIAAQDTEQFCYSVSEFPDGSRYVSLDAEQFFLTICQVVKRLAERLPQGAEVDGLSMVSASGNTLLCDAHDRPLIEAYSWTNTEMTAETEAVLGGFSHEYVASVTGWQFSDTFPLAHLSHLRVHAPRLLDEAAYVCMTTEYVILRLTGKRMTDRSTATPFYLQNQTEMKWHAPFLDKLGIPEGKLPQLCPSGFCVGNLTEEAQSLTGLTQRTRLYLGSFDHPGGAIAAGVKRDGELLISCGTSWVCFFPCTDRDAVLRAGLLCDTFLSPEGPWGAMLSIPQIGKTLDCLIERYISREPNKYALFEELAARAPKGAGGLVVDPLRPSDPCVGNHSKEEIARAIMEGMANALGQRLNMLRKQGIVFERAVMSGGPSKNQLFVDILSRTLNIPIAVTYGAYTGAVGAARICKGAFESSSDAPINR